MKIALSVLVLNLFFGLSVLAQTPAKPATRELTPAEQRQKEKIDREIQRERQIRAEWLQKQREYEAKQAEKERQKAAKKAGKAVEATKSAPTPVTPAPAVADQPTTPAPAVAEPARKEKKEKRRKEPKPTPSVETPATPVEPAVEAPAPVQVKEPKVKEPRPERVKRERKPKPVDSVSVAAAMNRGESVVRPQREFLPKGHLFDPILLDPLEAQTYGSILPAYWTEGSKYKGSIVPFAFGFAKPFYRRTTGATHAEEWVLDLASFTQFEAYHDDVADRARRRLINTDYKISIIYNVRRGENNYRFRVYHLSSHLGDDYIFRNKITAPSPNSVNYELLDVTYSRTVENWRLYSGLGVVLRKTEERKPLSAQLGAFYKKPSTHAARLVGGVDIKFWQQTNFRPGIHGGVGIELGRTQNNLTFLLEGYSGFRPYSQFEDEQTTWLGVGLYLNPF